MNEIIPFNFNEFKIRTMTDENGEPLFVVKDVCDALSIANSRDAFSRLEDYEQVSVLPTVGGLRNDTNFVNESGLYSLAMRSNKSEAKAFKKWITTEVLPSIRKTGGYGKVANQDLVDALQETIFRFALGMTTGPHKRQPGTPLTDEEKKVIDGCRNEYWPYAAIAREIGCDSRTVSRYVKSRLEEKTATLLDYVEVEDET